MVCPPVPLARQADLRPPCASRTCRNNVIGSTASGIPYLKDSRAWSGIFRFARVLSSPLTGHRGVHLHFKLLGNFMRQPSVLWLWSRDAQPPRRYAIAPGDLHPIFRHLIGSCWASGRCFSTHAAFSGRRDYSTFDALGISRHAQEAKVSAVPYTVETGG